MGTTRTVSGAVDALTIGETMVMVTPEAGGRLDARSTFLLSPGGAESNVAALLAGLGHRTAWASAVGDDPLGDIVVDVLAERGVDTGLVRRDRDRPTAVYFKDPAPNGTRVHYYRRGSAASAMSTADVADWTAARAPRLVHLTGITAAISDHGRELVRHLVHERPFGPAPLSFDVNYRAQLWNRDGDDAPAELLALAQRCDIVFVGRDEAEALWGTGDAESVRELLDAPPYVVVKDAAIEAVAFTPSGVVREPSRKVDVVDPVGAGDAFAAGWLSGFLHGVEENRRLRLGHQVASQVLGSPADLVDTASTEELLAAMDGVADVGGAEGAEGPEGER